MRHLLIPILFLGLLFVSCDENRIFDNYKSLDDYKWNVNNPVRFEVSIQDSSVSCNLFLKVRNNQDYENKNLWLFVKAIGPNGSIEVDTKIDCALADDEGKWLGKGLGDIFDSSHILKENFRFKHTGIYKFEIVHGMRKNIVSGLRDVGLRVEKKNSKERN